MNIKTASIELMSNKIKESVRFYQEVLGFNLEFIDSENTPTFAKLSNNSLTILIYAEEEFKREFPQLENLNIGGTFLINIEINDAKTAYKKLTNQNIEIIKQIYKTDYGTTEFAIKDPNGYIILFSAEG